MNTETIEIAKRQVRTLAILHYVWGGISITGGIALIVIYFSLGVGMMIGAGTMSGEEQVVMGILAGSFVIVAVLGATFIFAFAILSMISATSMLKRKNRIFSIVVAGIECASPPLGVLLGVFTIVILSKPEVRELYNQKA